MHAINEITMPTINEIKEMVLDALERLFNRKQPSTKDMIFKRIRQLLPAIVIAVVLVIAGRLGMLAIEQSHDNDTNDNDSGNTSFKPSVSKPSASAATYSPSPTYNRPETSNLSKTSN